MTDVSFISPLVAICGPTASGKSSLALWLAERMGGEVVACDSTQLYRAFNIGTAKPSAAERQVIPHHLMDVLDDTEEATAGGYRKMALTVLDDLRGRGRLPIFTVGTGLYLRVLLEGLAQVPERSDEFRDRLKDSATRHDSGYLHRVLRRLDRVAANKIDARDQQKLIRAIEICILGRKPISAVHGEGRTPLQGWRPLKVGLKPDREKMRQRINARTDAMLESGWMREVQELLAGASENAKPWDFIGYRALRAVLRREITPEDARDMIQQATRQYAKRQLTWFRREGDIKWFAGFGDDEAVRQEVLSWLFGQGIGLGRGAQERSV